MRICSSACIALSRGKHTQTLLSPAETWHSRLERSRGTVVVPESSLTLGMELALVRTGRHLWKEV